MVAEWRGRLTDSMPHYSVTGTFLARRGYWQPFTKTCEASHAEQAREWALSEIGGCHHVKRHLIRLTNVEELGS
ncbi:MAG: 50S ribosomal protein L18Ae [Thermoplasmata archaeon]